MGGALRWGRVVVIGNSIAGLLVAHVLADRADRVTIIDRDHIPDEPRHRAGIPHDRHIHVVLAAGRQCLEALLPGILDELASLGVPTIVMPRDMIQLNRSRWVHRWWEGQPLLTGTRPLVEHGIRRRVLAHPRIEAADSLEAIGLVGDRARVRGVRVRPRGADDEQTMAADLVVDASGRGSRTSQWLTEIGAQPPAEERIETGVAYATRRYRADANPTGGNYRAIYLVPPPGSGRSGVVMPIEADGHYLVTLTGLSGDEPPTDPDGFEAFAAGLEHSLVHDWLSRAEAVGPPFGYRSTANVRRRYDRLRGPDGLLVVGDAVTSFNPVYGQGISVAALGAQAVARALAQGQPSTARLQRLVVSVGEQAWRICTGVDKALPTATGNAVRTTPLDRVAGWYLDRVQRHATSDSVVGGAFRDVIHLVAPSRSLFAPRVVRTVLFRRPAPGAPRPPRGPRR
ncbi:MAG: FAD-dependent monooxygenase, partial [Micromonosporaceae bacterium]|nr:FAD-dependent monooxygenase [Micromonosporaceae bacterium]